jgi:hypothetical protein
MRKPQSVDALEKLGNERLSRSFYMREFLYSETANFHGIQNIPDNPDLALEVGRKLCEELLETLNATFPCTLSNIGTDPRGATTRRHRKEDICRPSWGGWN